MKSKTTWLVLGILFVGTVTLRCYHYTALSIDYDEFFTIQQVNSTSLTTVENYLLLQNVFQYKQINQQGRGIRDEVQVCFPFFFALLGLAKHFRDDIHFFRLIVISFGVLTPLGLFAIGKKYSASVAIISAVLWLFHPWAHFHSTYFRFYSLWAFIATFSLCYVEYVLSKLHTGQIPSWKVVVVVLLIFLPSTIHLFGVYTSFFLICMIGSHFFYHQQDLKRLSRANIMAFGLTFLMGMIVVGLNLLVFVYATLTTDMAVASKGSALSEQNAIHVIASTIFNVGLLFPLMPGGMVVLAIVNKASLRLPIKRYGLSLLLCSIPLIGTMLITPHMIRPDYLFGLFPYVLILTAFVIEAFAHSCQCQYQWLYSGMLTLCLVVSTLPTLVSNVFIDYDRFDFQTAAQFIAARPLPARFYSSGPGHFNVYLKDQRVTQINTINPATCQSSDDEYFLIWMRKGKSSYFYYNLRQLPGVQVLDIIGKDRIDLRANKIYVLFRKCS